MKLPSLEPPILLSVVVPVFNEARWVKEMLRRVEASDRLGCGLEIVVVDDCSTDGTGALLEALLAHHPSMRLFRQESNHGKGAALRRGFKEARGELVLVQDADLEYDPREYPALLRPLLDGAADVVFGSRFVGGHHQARGYWHAAGNRIVTRVSNAFTNLNLTDMETCFKAFRREVLERIVIREDRFGIEPEVTAKVARIGARVSEVPISYFGRTYAEGKKIGWKDGVRALWCVVRYGVAE